MSSVTEVKIGQIWRDNDQRTPGRQLEVIGIHGQEVTVQVVAHPKKKVIGKWQKIRLDRFTKARNCGYSLVRDAAPKPEAAPEAAPAVAPQDLHARGSETATGS